MSGAKANRSPWGPSRRSKGLVLSLAVLVLASCLLSSARADPPATTKGSNRTPFDASLVVLGETGDVDGIVALRAGEIFAAPGMARYAARVNQILAAQLPLHGLPSTLLVKVQDIDQIVARFILKPGQRNWFQAGLTTLRMKRPFDWAGFIKREAPTVRERKKDGVTWYGLDMLGSDGKSPRVALFCVIDDRTIVWDPLTIYKMIQAGKKSLPKPAWAADWKEVEGGLLAVLLNDPAHKYATKGAKALLPPNAGQEEKELGDLELKVARMASRVVLGVDAVKGISLTARFTCDKPADAAELEKACPALKFGLARVAGFVTGKSKFGLARVDALTIRCAGNQVIVTGKSKFGLARVAELFAPEPDDAPAPYVPFPPPPPPSR
jgi:hypothetical protein